MKPNHNYRRFTVCMLGARMHYAIPVILNEEGLLDRFYTDCYLGNKPLFTWILQKISSRFPAKSLKRLLGRDNKMLDPKRVISFDLMGMFYVLQVKFSSNYIRLQQVYLQAAIKFNRKIIGEGFGESSIVWGFNGASLEIFQNAKKKQMVCILEQTILPKSLELKLLREETSRWLGWQPSLIIPEADSHAISREEEEWFLSDYIVTGSDFVRTGLIELGVPPSKIHVIPYGVDAAKFPPRSDCKSNPSSKLKILFVGEVGLRKGVVDLLMALKSIGPQLVTARLAGSIAIEESYLEDFKDVATFLGSVPRTEIAELYSWADIFVLPSIVEGSATVTYEAILSGLPIITTANAGSIVVNNLNGFIVPIRSPEKIEEALKRYIDNPDLLIQHKVATKEFIKKASLNEYRRAIVDFISIINIDYEKKQEKAVAK